MKKVICILFAVILSLGIFFLAPINVGAEASETVKQDGLEVSIVTPQNDYALDEKIEISLNITNTNNYKVENISIETLLPKGLRLTSGNLSKTNIAIEPGATYTAEYTAKSLTNFILTLSMIIGIVVVVAGVIITVIIIIERKKAKRILSLLLCFTIILAALPFSVFGAESDEILTLTAQKSITVKNKNFTIKSNVSLPATAIGDYTVSFDTVGGSAIEDVIVPRGEKLQITTFPEKDGYIFAAWYYDAAYSQKFDFSKPVESSCKLYARWIDITDQTDTDGDGLTDPFEEYYETDPTLVDTDNDGLNDLIEITVLRYDALSKDTNSDGTADGQEDFDQDEINNLDELQKGTNIALYDTDADGLGDKEEFDTCKTDPLVKDTDGDGVSDGKEIELGTDPLVIQEKFDMNLSASNTDDSVKTSVKIQLSGNQVETLNIDPVNNDTFFPDTIPGYMGKAYDFSVDGEFTDATISFEFDSSKLSSSSEPVIYYFNESSQVFEELNTTISGNVASATVTHFSKYILVDRAVYQKSFTWTDVWDSNDVYTDVEIVLVIDDSGSMDWNDENNQRLEVAKTLVDKLPQNSKIGIVLFDDYTQKLTSKLTTDKETAKSYLTTTYFNSSGGTYMYDAIDDSFSMFKSTESSTLKMMVVLSDGESEGTYSQNSVISSANDKNIRIYTVGLGDSTSYFTNYLQPLATNTGGKFYFASAAEELAEIYKDISEKIDIETDSDDDDIPDYYEDNMLCFNGVKMNLDKNNPDSDGDGLKDGEEIKLTYEYNADRTKVKVTGKIVSGLPNNRDTDGDGLEDSKDSDPLVWNVSDRDLAILSQAIYSDVFTKNNFYISSLSEESIKKIDKNFHNTASIKELTGWELVYRYESTYTYLVGGELEGGLCFGVFKKDNNVVIVVRGSCGDGGILENFFESSDWRNNILTYPFKSDPDTDYLIANIKNIVTKYVGKNDNLYITGHSRGGMLAQRAAAGLVQQNCANKITRVVYFNGIGIIWVKGLWGTGKEWYDSLKSISNKVTRYEVTDDVVDNIGRHVKNSVAFDVSQTALKHHKNKTTQKHALCNFTYYLMPERLEKI